VGPLWGRCRHGRHTEHLVTDCCAGRSGIGCLGASRAREKLGDHGVKYSRGGPEVAES
jgi:hypothetical protein